jgi:hypothetical protein
MKATLEFVLPEESHDHLLAVKARDMPLALWDISMMIRNKLKRDELTQQESKAWEDIRECFYSVIDDYELMGAIEG